MMLDWLSQTHDHRPAAEAALRIERAVDKAYTRSIKPMEFGGGDGTAAIGKAVLEALDEQGVNQQPVYAAAAPAR